MAYKEQYITYEEYIHRFKSHGIWYDGFVIGYGYVYCQWFNIEPPHMNGYHRGERCPPLYGEDSCSVTGFGFCEERTPEAITHSMTPIVEELSNRIIKDNGNGTVTVNMGLGKYITIDKELKSNIKISATSDNKGEVSITISAEASDGLGNRAKNETTIAAKDLKMAFDSKWDVTNEVYTVEKEETMYTWKT